MLSRHQKLIKRMSELSEDHLTTKVIIPLLKTMSWEKVDYHGGPYEGGKDIICWKKSEFDMNELLVVQVKKYKPSARASSNDNIGEVVNQLHQASEKKIPNIDGHKYIPDLVFFITPFEIDVRSLESRFEGYAELSKRRVKIIDGSMLSRQVIKSLPSVARDLIGNEIAIPESMVPTLNNKELMNSLNINSSIKISSYYCDLNFGIGHITTKILLELTPVPIKTEKSISAQEWKKYKNELNFIESALNCPVLEKDEITIEQEYQDKVVKFKNCSAETNLLEKKIEGLDLKLNGLVRENEEIVSSIKEDILKNTKNVENERNNDVNDFFSSYRQINDESFDEKNKNLIAYQQFDNSIISLEKFLYNSEIFRKNQNKITIIDQNISKYQADLSTRLANQTPPNYEFSVSGNHLCNKLDILKETLKGGIAQLEKDDALKNLGYFIRNCERILTKSDQILSCSIIGDLLYIDTSEKYRPIGDIPRLNFSVHDIFDIGYNTFILGEAGAGKTTTLQMYAQQKYNDNSRNTPTTLFIPLTRAINTLEIDGIQEFSDRPYGVRLTHGIRNYLETLGGKITFDDFDSLLQSQNTILLLDGLDEAVSSATWIHKGVADLSRNYPKAQIVTSSRMVGEYMKDIPFFSITLLPLTKIQRSLFISSWFKEKPKQIEIIEKHLENNKELEKIIRTPLLTTLLCVLADNHVQLPENEVRLYAERFQLLLGQYDIHKKVSRNTVPRIKLEKVARKIAFLLYKSNRRYAKVEYLKKIARSALSEKYDETTINTAVDELINPCNVIVPMTSDGQFGFDHLRYQEYLVAEEIVNNRGIDITLYLHDSWWKGPLVLFSQLTDDLEFIVSDSLITGRYKSFSENINAMLAHRPENERDRLNVAIQKHNQIDVFDSILFQEIPY